MNILFRILSMAALISVSAGVSAGPLGKGDAAPDIILGSDMQGHDVRVADFNGEIVVLSFWASWCGPCRKEIPQLDALQRVAEQKHAGLQVVAINIEDRETFRKVAVKIGDARAKIVNERNKASARAYGVKGIPHLVIIGRDGHIAQTHVGYGEKSIDAILDEINSLLSAPAHSG